MDEASYKVILSKPALDDLEETAAYIARDNPAAAERFTLQLIAEAETVGQNPMAGRMVPEFSDPSIRERIFHSYRIVYRVQHNPRLVVISRFWHAARGEPEVFAQ